MEINSAPQLETLPVVDLELDPRVEVRNSYSSRNVSEYASRMKEGQQLPPIDVFEINMKMIVVDGWHRVKAAQKLEIDLIQAKVYRGFDLKDAIIFAASANQANGIRMTRLDKKKAVHLVLLNSDFQYWSDRAIAKICGVSHIFVSKEKRKLISEGRLENKDYLVCSNGKRMKSQKVCKYFKQINEIFDDVGSLQKIESIPLAVELVPNFNWKECYEKHSSDNSFKDHVFHHKIKGHERMNKMKTAYILKLKANREIIQEKLKIIYDIENELQNIECDMLESEKYMSGMKIFCDIFTGLQSKNDFNLP